MSGTFLSWRFGQGIFHSSSYADLRRAFEPRHEKTNCVVSEQVRHKPVCAVTEDAWRLEILDLESRGIKLQCICVAKSAKLICAFVLACIQIVGFLMRQLICFVNVERTVHKVLVICL